MTGADRPIGRFGGQRIEDFLDVLASKSPSPGGGAVASVTGALAAALAQMVISFSKGKKRLADNETLYDQLGTLLKTSRGALLALAAEDAEAYQALNELQRLPEDDPRRSGEWKAAVARAIDVPRRSLDLSLEILRMCESLLGRSNEWLRSDLAIAAVLGEAAATAAAWNVRINLPLLGDESERRLLDEQIRSSVEEARALRSQIESVVSEA